MEKGFSNMKETKSLSVNVDESFKASKKRLGYLINTSGLSNKEIANQLNVSEQAVSRWRHEHCFISCDNLFLLSRVLGIPADDFFAAS